MASPNSTISLDHLIALNDEMAALVRAGVPLEQGLVELGQEMPGRLGHLSTSLGRRLQSGQSLSSALASEGERLPAIWRAVVEAGLRSGNLSAALEALATSGRRVAETRRAAIVALVYPLLILLLAYLSFLFLVTHFAPVTLRAYEDLTQRSEPLLSTFVWLGQSAKWWAVWLPLALLLAYAYAWYRSTRATLSISWLGRVASRIIPSSATALRDGRMASFAEILALLLRQQVPLHEAIILAADACGDPARFRWSHDVAARLRRGERLATSDACLAPFPPLLGWLIAYGSESATLSQALTDLAARYRDRAERAANWLTVYLPVCATVVVGGAVVMLQGAALFIPICRLLYQLGMPA